MPQENSEETLCQKCGVTGYAEFLVYCSTCQISAEHSYCLSVIPQDEEFTWSCEMCVPSLPKKPSLHELSSVPTRRSTRRKQRSSRAAKTYQNFKRHDNINFSIGEAEAEEQTGSQLHVVANAGDAPMEISSYHPSKERNNSVHAQPIIKPVWRGSFEICNEKYDTIVGHLSNKACLKVFEGANSLPPLLHMEVLSRLEAWPKSFQQCRPTDENIALYFFPGNERKAFEELLHEIIVRDLALKALIDNAELLIFSSPQLPPEDWRFNGRYYLWGVFRSRRVSHSHESADHLLIKNSHTDSTSPISAVNSNERKGSAKAVQIGNPRSPLRTGSSCRSDSPHSLILRAR